MCKIIAIANQKGGVAKTTTTINLGVGLSKVGKRVMLIDADPQGHLTMGLGFPKNLRVTLKTMMDNIIMGLEFDPREAILHHEEGIDVIPSNTKKGIGLIERVKQGFGKPDIIYVKNFILRTSKDVKNNDESEESIQQNREVVEVDLSESEKSTYRGRKNRLQGVGKTDFKRSEKPTSGTRKIRLQEVGKTDFKRSEIQSLFILTIIRLIRIILI